MEPPGHGVQTSLPRPVEKVPAAQSIQVDEATEELNLPAEQTLHVVATLLELLNVPNGHAEQVTSPSGRKYPGRHGNAETQLLNLRPTPAFIAKASFPHLPVVTPQLLFVVQASPIRIGLSAAMHLLSRP
jgi:hypothetical protein